MIKLRTANRNDVETLSEIAISLKAYWGYPSSWLKLWEEYLTVTIEQVQNNTIFNFLSIACDYNLFEIS